MFEAENGEPVKPIYAFPLWLLPPSRGIKLIRNPPVCVSAVELEVVIANSAA